MCLASAEEDLSADFSEVTVIGKGMTATVYSALHKKTMKTVAIKQINRSTLINSRVRQSFENELKILESADHPFISLFYNLIQGELYFYLVIEIANRGTLGGFVSTRGALREKESVRVFCETLSAINYLHRHLNIIHRDIKTDNILFDDFFNVRLIDFGLGKITDPNVPMVQTTCGTYPFTAPEILKHEKYDKEVDIWSLGVCLYIMSTCELPFKSNNQKVLIDQIINEEPNYPSKLGDDLVDLLKKMLQKDPTKRITPEEIAQHPWISSSKYSVYLTDAFMVNSQFLVNGPIDEKIAQNMAAHGLDEKKYNELFTEDAMYYRIMKKAKILELLKSTQGNLPMPQTNSFKNSIAQRHAFCEKRRKLALNIPYPASDKAQKSTPNLETHIESNIEGDEYNITGNFIENNNENKGETDPENLSLPNGITQMSSLFYRSSNAITCRTAGLSEFSTQNSPIPRAVSTKCHSGSLLEANANPINQKTPGITITRFKNKNWAQYSSGGGSGKPRILKPKLHSSGPGSLTADPTKQPEPV